MNAVELKGLKDQMDRLEKTFGDLSKPRSAVGSPAGVLAGFQPTNKRNSYEWPVQDLEKLAKSYNSEQALMMLTKGNRQPRLSGFGPALCKMAALANPNCGIVLPGNYGLEQFEKEHGFTTLQKARSEGVKGINGEVRKTALAEGSGLTGGYIVPPQFMNELLTIAAEDAFIEPRAKVLPMTSRTAQWPTLDITTVPAGGTSPYFGGILGSWQPEAATINETEPQFKQSEWTAWDLVLYTLSSNQLLADNGIGLDALLTQLFGAAMTFYKELAFLQGKGAGSSMPLGVLNAPATYVQNRTTSNKFLYPDAAAMMSHLQIRSWKDACWVMHQSVLPQLLLMHDYTGASNVGNRLVWVNPVMPGDVGPAASAMPNAFLNGLPLFFTEKVPALGTKGDVMLIDWSRYVIGMRLDIQIDVSPHYQFRNNQLAWRVVCRLDGRPWLSGPIVDQSGWTISPFIVLNT